MFGSSGLAQTCEIIASLKRASLKQKIDVPNTSNLLFTQISMLIVYYEL